MKDKTDIYRKFLHKDYSPPLFDLAKMLRKQGTLAEKKLWKYLRNRKLNGKKFRRQHVIDQFIIDFYCHECRLAIELDGQIHNRPEIIEYDERRTECINEHHIKVLRIKNKDVFQNIHEVLELISKYLDSSSPLL